MADKKQCVCGKGVVPLKSGEPRKHVCNAPDGPAWAVEAQPIVPADVDETGHVCTYTPGGRGTENRCACGELVSDGPVPVPAPGKVTDDPWRMTWSRETGFRFKVNRGYSFRAACGHRVLTNAPYRKRPEGGFECRGEWKLFDDAPIPTCMLGRPDTLDRALLDSRAESLTQLANQEDSNPIVPADVEIPMWDGVTRPIESVMGQPIVPAIDDDGLEYDVNQPIPEQNWNGTGRPRPSATNVAMPPAEPVTEQPRLLDMMREGVERAQEQARAVLNGPALESAAIGMQQMAKSFGSTADVNAFLSPSQSGIGSGDANDFLSQPEPQALGSATGQPETERDRYGRYLVKDPRTGDFKRSRRGTPEGFTRATTYAKTLLDTYGLNQWEKCMVAVGMSLRPDLVQRAKGLDVTADKAALEEIHEVAKEAAGGSEASSAGTEFHTVTEHLDAGLLTPETVPEEWRTMAKAYADKMAWAGLTTRTEWIERITFTDRGGEDVTGTADRVLLERDGTPVIGDVKSGKGIDLAEREIAIQLLTYAMGVNQYGLYNKATGRWEPWTGPPISEEYGIVMHVPVQRPNNRPAYCDLYRIDFTDVQGFDVARALQAAAWTRRWRKAKGFAVPYSPPAAVAPRPVAPRQRTWAEAFSSVTTPEEANRLWEAAVEAGMDSDALDVHVQNARAALAKLQSQ